MKIASLLACAAALSCAAVLTGGCATVRPWERERLAHPAMADDPDPEASAFDGHVAGARDAALDPAASGGGGCGCN